MAGQIEDIHHAFPHGLALEGLAHGNRLNERRRPAVHALDGSFELIDSNFGHVCRISQGDGGGHATGRLFPARGPIRFSFFA
jgi:hypothetical protein